MRACASMFETVGIVSVSASRYSSPPTRGSLPEVASRSRKRHGVDRLSLGEQLHHRFVDEAVRVSVEVARAQRHLGDGVERLVLEQNAAEHCTLGVLIVRRNATAGRTVGHAGTDEHATTHGRNHRPKMRQLASRHDRGEIAHANASARTARRARQRTQNAAPPERSASAGDPRGGDGFAGGAGGSRDPPGYYNPRTISLKFAFTS